MSQNYRVALGSFDAKARSWNVDLLSAAHARVEALEQDGEPLLAHLWEHTVGSPTIRWTGGEDEPPPGMVCVVKLKMPKAALGAIVALGLVSILSLAGAAFVYVERAEAQKLAGFSKTQLAEARLELKAYNAEAKLERQRSVATELFTRGGVNYAQH
ncbi:MAG: hypothetical protein SFV15_16295 [Polyangiaceae bacterium]|nr:hypothetical protein [Polyangiaceae bacterium]